MPYICAFRGRRDSYEVPIALAEAHELELFITDHYCGGLERAVARILPERLGEIVTARCDGRIPSDRVKRLRLVALGEGAARIWQLPPASLYHAFDPLYGVCSAAEARRRKCDLFMYSPYAWDAFTASYRHTPRRVLFQFHPHYSLENAILEEDRLRSAANGISFVGHLESLGTQEATIRHRGDVAWEYADHVICASTFTKLSLLEAGADSSRISVVPYGVQAPPPSRDNCGRDLKPNFHALFVGSGLQRKGLHHLLLAWRKAQLPRRSQLTIVSRALDPGLHHLLRDTREVNLLKGVTERELHQLYETATVFVMPSLVEGFGQVYLEALSHGLPVIGTSNTCLPDIGDESGGVFVTMPGAIDELVSLLERLSSFSLQNTAIRDRAKQTAARFTWERFRTGLQAVI